MKKNIFLAGAALTLSLSMLAETPLWLRHPAVSPDGKIVVFSYKGDLFSVPVTGGLARQLTTNAGYDAYPVWSSDGKKIAFASDREGSMDVFYIPASGGAAKRLTTHSANEIPRAWLNDSTVVFTATIQPAREAAQALFYGQTYTVATDGKRPKMLKSIPMPALDIDSKGRIVFQDKKGYENEFRKHERSSGTSDIWLIDNDKFTRLTDFNGHDLNPQFVKGSEDIAYVSETDGTLNVWLMDSNGKNERQVTKFEKHPVRNLTVADDGLMVFAWNGEIYTVRFGEEPRKIPVEVIIDDYEAAPSRSIETDGATNMAVSADGDQIAFVLRGDVYVTSKKYKTTRRITNTSWQERCISFSPDGRSLVYDSDRDGQWKLYTATIDNAGDKTFPYASSVTETLLYAPADGKPAQQPVFSPDGKKVAFLEDRTELRVIDVKTKDVHTALDGKYNYSYSDGDVEFTWSPDSKWFLTSYIGEGGWNNTDIALVSADGKTVVDLTESGYTDYNPRWAMDGRAVAYTTGRFGMRSHGSWGEQGDVMLMFLDPEAWDEYLRTAEEADIAKKDKNKDEEEDEGKAKKSKKNAKKTEKADTKELKFDLDNRRYRVARLTGSSSNIGDYFVNKEGTKLYYVASATEGGRNLFERDLRKGSSKVLIRGLSGGLEADSAGNNLFALTGSGMKVINLESGDDDDIEFEAIYENRPSAERQYIFDHMVSQVRDKFYDESLHGVDWDMYAENYRRFLPYINNNYDFADLLSEILGELNASHTGGHYYADGADMPTASLGAFFDTEYDGDGLKVAEVLPRGPLAHKNASVKAGDIILAIDGTEITPSTDLNKLLDGRDGKPVRITLSRYTGALDTVIVRPVSSGNLSQQLYQRWVERNEAMVDSLSGGRLAYVHVKDMDSPSFREVYSRLLGHYRNKEAVIVDTRYNGGGWLHNDIAQLLNGKEYVRYAPRGRYIGSDPFSQWTKPSVMLVNEANYSDAHGTPYVYQTLGIGDVVGAPVPGTMTAVWWETQIDPSIVFGIPQVTSLDRNGKPLENHQLNPDVVILTDPAEVLKGNDPQIAGAVKVLLEKLDKKK